jgi:hypothetical protein
MTGPRAIAALFVLLASCHSKSILFSNRPWPMDQSALLILTTPDDVPIEATPRLYDPQNPEIPFPKVASAKLHILTYPPPDQTGPDFQKCGVAFGGGGGIVNGASHAYVSDVLMAQGGALQLHEVDAQIDAGLFNLNFVSCSYPCDKISIVRLTPLPGANLDRSIAATRDNIAFFTIDADTTTTTTKIGRIRDNDAEPLMLHFPGQGVGKSIVYDRGSTLYLATASSKIISIDFSGNLVGRFATTSTTPSLSAGTDGTIVEHGDGGLHVVAATAAGRIAPLPGAVDLFALDSINRAVASNSSAFWYWNGTTWSHERDIAASSIENFRGLAIDQDNAVAVGSFGLISQRDTEGTWKKIAPPPKATAATFVDVRGLGKGRFFAVAEHGYAALWTGQGWCELQLDTTAAFHGMDVDPSGRSVYGVGDGSPGIIYRFDLPPD